MADIAASGLTYTMIRQQVVRGRKVNIVKIVLPDADAGTYPSAGIPLLRAKLGCPNVLEKLIILDGTEATTGAYLFRVVSDEKLTGAGSTEASIRIFQGDNNNASDSTLVELGAVDPGLLTFYVEASGY